MCSSSRTECSPSSLFSVRHYDDHTLHTHLAPRTAFLHSIHTPSHMSCCMFFHHRSQCGSSVIRVHILSYVTYILSSTGCSHTAGLFPHHRSPSPSKRHNDSSHQQQRPPRSRHTRSVPCTSNSNNYHHTAIVAHTNTRPSGCSFITALDRSSQHVTTPHRTSLCSQ